MSIPIGVKIYDRVKLGSILVNNPVPRAQWVLAFPLKVIKLNSKN